MAKLKLTKDNMSLIVKPESGQVDYYDTVLPRFGCRATKNNLTFFVYATQRGTGKKSWFLLAVMERLRLTTPEQSQRTTCNALTRVKTHIQKHSLNQKQ